MRISLKEVMANGVTRKGAREVFLALISASVFVWGQGCRVDQNQTLGGEARAVIVVSYPAAEACFDDTRVTTFEHLKICLELTTAQRWTVDAEGMIVETITEGLGGGAVSEPSNIMGSN